MTEWKQMKRSGQTDEFKERLGKDAFDFIKQDNTLHNYLEDYKLVRDKLVSQMKGIGLEDNSPFVLTICKLFEGVLIRIAEETGWLSKYGSDQDKKSIRRFWKNNRTNIESEIDQKISDTNKRQEIKDKFFSITNDFKDRHVVLHYGSFLHTNEVENYNSILTKIKEVISLMIDNSLITRKDE